MRRPPVAMPEGCALSANDLCDLFSPKMPFLCLPSKLPFFQDLLLCEAFLTSAHPGGFSFLLWPSTPYPVLSAAAFTSQFDAPDIRPSPPWALEAVSTATGASCSPLQCLVPSEAPGIRVGIPNAHLLSERMGERGVF